MKRRYIIIIFWGLWVCSLIGAYFLINSHIDEKRNKLHSEIVDNISSLFEGQDGEDYIIGNDDGFFDVDFSYNAVRNYKKIDIPSKPLKDHDYLGKAEAWERNYGDLVSLYELNWGDKYPNQNDEGWNIIRIYSRYYSDDDVIQSNIIFPYRVGFKKNQWGISYSVEEAVNDAFEFYTTNIKSGFAERFQKGSVNRLWSKIHDCDNRYYTITKNNDYDGWITGTPICQPNNSERTTYDDIIAERKSPYENGSMYNGFYRVFIAATQETHYMIKEKEYAVKADRERLFKWWGIGLTLLFFSFIIPLMVFEKKSKKIKSENLYQRLSRLCNPKVFIQNYDKEKVDKANGIYKRLMETKPDDKEALMEIQKTAVSELGITLIDNDEVEELKEKVNPKRFLNPYNAEKVALANELYAILSKEGLTYNEFVEVEEKSLNL